MTPAENQRNKFKLIICIVNDPSIISKLVDFIHENRNVFVVLPTLQYAKPNLVVYPMTKQFCCHRTETLDRLSMS